MSIDLPTTLVQTIQDRRHVNGGFSFRLGGECRPDATAWAILALQATGAAAELQTARACLRQDQLPDGRLAFSPQHPEAFWPTPLAIMAWQHAPEFQPSQDQAVQFLLKTTGRHVKKDNNNVIGHDPLIKGWPWIENTHSWVVPTSLAVIALKAVQFSGHERAREAVCLLLDRQLPKGGWNYGNTSVYGQELHPMAESTGVALSALTGMVPRDKIEPSLIYLKKRIIQVQTPLALSWGLLGLAAWDLRPPEFLSWLEACWGRQERFGGYDTTALALMLLALTPKAGFSPTAENLGFLRSGLHAGVWQKS